MKYIEYKSWDTATICSIVISGMVLLCTSQTYAQSNLIKNPSFEDRYNGWQQIEPVSISDHFRTGVQSSKISTQPGLITQTVSVSPYTDYIFEGFIKGSGQIGVNTQTRKITDQVVGASDWLKATVEFNSGSASTVDVFASFYNEQGRFDDFTLITKPKPVAATRPTSSSTSYSGQSNSRQYTSTSSPQCPGMGYLPITSAFDNGNDGNIAANAIDGDLTNRWSSQGIGKSITFNLSRISEVRELSVMWYKGYERIFLFSVETSTDGRNWSMVLSDASSTPSDGFETYNIENLLNPEAKMVRIIGGGNSLNDWNSIVELKVKGCVN